MERFAPGQRFFTHWQLRRLLWQCSRSAVYELWRTELGVTYRSAMKVVSVRREGPVGCEPGADYPPAARRAVWERFILSRLQGCSHVVSYADHDTVPHADGSGWDFLLRMELLTPLLEAASGRFRGDGPVIALGTDICRGLEFCQQNGVVHRDVKPGNLYVTELGVGKLGDFSLSRLTVDGRGAPVGTRNYMAPEVWQAGEASYCADVYSLGLTLYTLLNGGRLPFCEEAGQDRERAALDRRMAAEPLPRPRHGSDRLWSVVEQACAFAPEARFASARGLRNALEQL